jgi:hypothetical protein
MMLSPMAGEAPETPSQPLGLESGPAGGSPAASLFSARDWNPGTLDRSDAKAFTMAIEKALDEILSHYGGIGSYLRSRYETHQSKQEFANHLCQLFPMSLTVSYAIHTNVPTVSIEASNMHVWTNIEGLRGWGVSNHYQWYRDRCKAYVNNPSYAFHAEDLSKVVPVVMHPAMFSFEKASSMKPDPENDTVSNSVVTNTASNSTVTNTMSNSVVKTLVATTPRHVCTCRHVNQGPEASGGNHAGRVRHQRRPLACGEKP